MSSERGSRRSFKRGDRSSLNPAAPSRRRLLKAAGLVGMAGLVSLDWKTPVVRLGSLPAHAQPSLAVGCGASATYSLNALPTGSNIPLSLSILADGGSLTLTSSTFSGSGSLSVEGGGSAGTTLTVGVAWSVDSQSGTNAAIFRTVSCCTDSAAQAQAPVATTGSWPDDYGLAPGDDGSCEIELL